MSPVSPKVSNLNNIPLDEMSIEIVDDLNDEWQTGVENCKPPVRYFNPLTDVDWYQAALNFNIKLGPSHMVKTSGTGTVCHTPPEIFIEATANGACLFNSASILITGSDTYSAIIRHVVCNYISNPVKYEFLKMYIPPPYKSGKKYIVQSNMCNFHSWGTEVEIIALAQISGFDVMVYTCEGAWLRYKSFVVDHEESEWCMYLSNESGDHFNPVTRN